MAGGASLILGLILLIIGLIIGISFTVSVVHDHSKKKKTSTWNIVLMILGYIIAFIGLVLLLVGWSQSKKKVELPECLAGCDADNGAKNVSCHGTFSPGTQALAACLQGATTTQQACNSECATKYPQAALAAAGARGGAAGGHR